MIDGDAIVKAADEAGYRHRRPTRRHDADETPLARRPCVGVGISGKHHARILSTLPGVELVAVVDTNRARAEEIAAAHGTRALYDSRDLPGQVDAVTIAVPTELHREIALPFLDGAACRCSSRSRWRDRSPRPTTMIAAAARRRRRARGRTHRALQSGGRSGAAAAERSAVHRSPSPRHVSRAQPRHRRRLRSDDSRSRRRAVARRRRGRVDRGGRRAGADRAASTSRTRACGLRTAASRT